MCSACTPSQTPTPEPMEPLTLLGPEDGETFASANSRPVFSWSEAPRPLVDNEYYVLIIAHKDGKDFIWTKATMYTAGDDKTAPKASHRNIPSWEEAIGIVISANQEARAKSPAGKPSRGGRGGRGRGGRGKSSDKKS